MSRRGRLVTFEGGEGAGKSTQIAALVRLAEREGRAVVRCREPGGTHLGEAIRSVIKAEHAARPTPEAELLLFNAARAQLVREVVRPALERGALVLSDRFADSTVAYQHYGRGLDRGMVEAVNAAATGGLVPDLTVLLDLEPEVGLRRREGEDDYLEREGLEFHRRVRRGYLELAAAAPERWLVLDATKPELQVTHAIWERIGSLKG